MKAAIAAVAVVLCVGMAMAAPAKAETSTYAKLAAQATKQDKLLLADFFTDWCYWCQQLDKKVYPDKRVSELIDKYFVLAKINAEQDTATASKYDVSAYPTIVILDTDGVVLKKILGYEAPKLFAADLEDAIQLKHERAEAQQLKKDLASGKTEDAANKEARLGHILLRLRDTKDAAHWLGKAKAGGVNTPDLQLDTALATLQSIELVQALNKWVVANPESPRRWEATYDLGMAQEKAQQWSDALASMNLVVAGSPETLFGLRAAMEVKPLQQRVADENKPPEPGTVHG